MTARKERPGEEALQQMFENLHFFDEANIDIGEGELEPPEEEADDMEGSPEQELGMMSDEEFDDFIGEYFASKRRGEASTDPLVEAIRDLVEKHLGKQP